MLARNCPKLSAIHDPGYDNRSFFEEYAPLDHTSVRFPSSFTVLNLRTSDHWLPTRHV